MSRIIHYTGNQVSSGRWNNFKPMRLSKAIEPMRNTEGCALTGPNLITSGACSIEYSASEPSACEGMRASLEV